MKEIGGYIELEQYNLPMLHGDAIKLNCGRNCLAYLIKARRITRIVLPYFLCDSVKNTCISYGVEVNYYHVNEAFMPVNILLEKDEWLYVVNYYGQLKLDQIQILSQKYGRVIVDYAQAYFDRPVEGIDSLYTCRKFLGVPDGAFLYTDVVLDEVLKQDESFQRMHFLLGRFERTAGEFYSESITNNHLFDAEPIKLMSKLTHNLLHGIDYERVKKNRTENYVYLARRLEEKNLLKVSDVEGAFAYPLMREDAPSVRNKLIENKVYIPTLWPNVLNEVEVDALEYKLANNILPIPCDQRYGTDDMEYVSSLIRQYTRESHCV